MINQNPYNRAFRPLSQLAPGLLFFLVIGVGGPARASIVVQSAGVSNSVEFFGDFTHSLGIGTDQLGHQSDSLDFAGPGVSATLRYEMTTPDPIGTGFAVTNFVQATVPLGGSILASATAGFGITFEVDETQDFLLFGQDTNLGHPMDGLIEFQDLTAGTTLFSIFFDDFSGPVAWEFTLLGGHVYSFTASSSGDLDPFFEDSIGKEFMFRLNAVPEPSTLALAALGGVGLLAYGWRRRRRA